MTQKIQRQHGFGSRESWRLSPRVNHSQRTTRESASRISSASANETNDDERVNESGERGQFVHFKESFVRTDSFANEPTLVGLQKYVLPAPLYCMRVTWRCSANQICVNKSTTLNTEMREMSDRWKGKLARQGDDTDRQVSGRQEEKTERCVSGKQGETSEHETMYTCILQCLVYHIYV